MNDEIEKLAKDVANVLIEDIGIPMLKGRLKELERLVKQFHGARGRYHTQIAYCELMEFMGLPCHRPEKGKQKDF